MRPRSCDESDRVNLNIGENFGISPIQAIVQCIQPSKLPLFQPDPIGVS
jgi:hypothetical protein